MSGLGAASPVFKLANCGRSFGTTGEQLPDCRADGQTWSTANAGKEDGGHYASVKGLH